MAKAYLLGVCGEPPSGYQIEETSHECDMGGVGDVASYTMLSITWESPRDMDEKGWSYYQKCEEALEKLEDAVSWPDLRPQTAD